ncbi:MAG: ATP-binding protein [Alphaproteobacteria bacterium]|nr:ATP-binding protein [Alphaproteobacteria bacterium]MBL6777427.1 ATP-binding protein [Alphaproteobacteria bacterium]
MTPTDENLDVLTRIADALERLAPPKNAEIDLTAHEGYIWVAEKSNFHPVDEIQRLPLESLQGIDQQKQKLLENTEYFAKGMRANNALLWGARGTGKSSVMKAVHGHLLEAGYNIGLVEIQREDLSDLPEVMERLARIERAFIIFCDDLAFEQDDISYKSLKAVLEGGLSGRPRNLVFYATSNRRHLMPRDMIENERSTAINRSEASEEKISLSDRFGLWIGFHNIDQDTYLEMIRWYIDYYKIPVSYDIARQDSLTWAIGRGNRSGRTAFQYILNLAMQHGVKI